MSSNRTDVQPFPRRAFRNRLKTVADLRSPQIANWVLEDLIGFTDREVVHGDVSPAMM